MNTPSSIPALQAPRIGPDRPSIEQLSRLAVDRSDARVLDELLSCEQEAGDAHLGAALRRSVRVHALCGIPIALREGTRDARMLVTAIAGCAHAPPAALPPRPLVLILGAHIGISARLLRTTHPGAELICLEPHPDNLDLLRHNLLDADTPPLERLPDVQCVHAAGWYENSRVQIGGPWLDRQRVFATGTVDEPSTPARAWAPALCMAGLVESILRARAPGRTRIDYVLLDVQGSEGMIFETDLSWLSRVGCVRVHVRPPSVVERVEHQLRACGLLVRRDLRASAAVGTPSLVGVSRRLAGAQPRFPVDADRLEPMPPPI